MKKSKYKSQNVLGNDSEFYHQYKIGELKYDLRRKNLVPIIKDNYLYIYRVSAPYIEFSYLLRQISQKYKESYYKLIDKDNYNDPYCGVKLPGLDRIEFVVMPSKQDIIRYYHLDEEKYKIIFLDKFGNKQLKVNSQNDNASNTDINLELEKTINSVKLQKLLAKVRRESKIYQTLFTTLNPIEHDFYLEFIAKELYQFVYNKNINFAVGNNTSSTIFLDIESMPCNKSEKELLFEEKMNLLRKVYNNLEISCVYKKTIKNARSNHFDNISNNASKENIVEIARHNTSLLFDSEFAQIYYEIKNVKQKVKKLV